MTHYYLGLGYGKTYSTGMFSNKPSLPLTEEDLISELEFTLSDDPFDYELVRQEQVSKLEPGDTLHIAYPNQAALYILDEWSEDYDIPNNEREEVWTTEGVQGSHTHFENAEDQDWYWLTSAEVDYYDDDGRPVPMVSVDDEEDWEE